MLDLCMLRTFLEVTARESRALLIFIECLTFTNDQRHRLAAWQIHSV